MKKDRRPNLLISESSPYLLQHAYNPVDWHPYSTNAFKKAAKQKKLIIISIGYSSCHWCHVMEHESFEDMDVARVMNRDYISIKVDREERPDVDQIYIHAVQLMTGSAGWPLNVVTLPDGRPVWGGTYFRKPQWIQALQQIQELFLNEPQKLIAYANRLENGIKSMDLIEKNEADIDFENYSLESAMNRLSADFDLVHGGFGKAPKFMMPNSLEFLMRYAHQTNNMQMGNFVRLTLNKMAFGGVFDHINGGFSRYSVDERWHIPHFEKMLYDNALLINLYSKAYRLYQDQVYKETAVQTINFVEKELSDASGMYFSALDADSINQEGNTEEGAYYYFTIEELQTATGEDFNIFQDYYNINDLGHWEANRYVLIRNKSDSEVAETHQLDLETLRRKKQNWQSVLSNLRNKKSRPNTDDKSLTSWNAMMISALLEAYRAFDAENYLKKALDRAEFLLEHQLCPHGSLKHVFKSGKSTIPGFLEDYAFVIDMTLNLYETTFDWKWINLAEKLTEYTFTHFFDSKSNLFFFATKDSEDIIHRSKEYYDNVIPSSNSVMAKALFRLAKLTGKSEWEETSHQMLKNLLEQIENHPRGFGNWMDLLMNFKFNYYEIVLTGPDFKKFSKELNKTYLPNKILAGTDQISIGTIFKNRYKHEENLIYICQNNTCRSPVRSISETLNIIK